jgi:hypothetical protein
MIEVYSNLFVGSADDYERLKNNMVGWAVVHAAKDPYHRNAVGYSGRSAPKGPEYLFAYRNGQLFLNIVDVQDERFFSKELIDEAVRYTINNLRLGKKVLIHCNQGESRAPVIAMLTMHKLGVLPDDFLEAEDAFADKYPIYAPGKGIRAYAIHHWNEQ